MSTTRCTAPQSPLDCVGAEFESAIASEARFRASRLLSRSPSPTSPLESHHLSFRRQRFGSARFNAKRMSSSGGQEETDTNASLPALRRTSESSPLSINAGVAMEWSIYTDRATSRERVVSYTTECSCDPDARREHSVSFAANGNANDDPLPRSPRLESSRMLLPQSPEHRHSSVSTGPAPQFPTASTELVRIASARRRVLEHRTSVMDTSNKLASDESFKQIVAAERKNLLTQQGTLRRVMCWEILVVLRRANWLFVSKTVDARLHHALWQKMNLKIACWIRRPLRRARLRLMMASHPPVVPTVADLRKDKLLDLFSDGCLRHISSQLQLRYYFPNETIIFMSCRDTEAYVMVSGTADVVVRQTKVFTIFPGGIFGVVGMVSGEPRTATVVARDHTVVWYVSRHAFDSYESPDDDVTANARNIIAEMRATNFQNVYHSLLEIGSMQYFRLFHGVGRELLTALSTRGTPKVIPCGTALYSKDSNIPGELGNSAACVVLRGTVRVYVDGTFAHARTTNPMTMCEVISKVVQLREMTTTGRSPGGAPDSIELHVQQYFCRRSATCNERGSESAARRSSQKAPKDAFSSTVSVPAGFVPVMDLPSPTLINLVGVFQPHESPVTVFVAAREELDVLLWTREFVFRQDVIELAEVRRRCHTLQLDWLPRLTSLRLCRTLVRTCSGLASISSLKPAKLKPNLDGIDRVLLTCCERGWLERDEFVTYAKASSEKCALLITEGAVQYTTTTTTRSATTTVSVTQSGEKTASQLWPSVSQIVFADADVVARVTSPRILFYKIRRIHLLQWLSCVLTTQDVAAFMSVLVQESLQRASAPAFQPLTESEWNAAVPIDTTNAVQVSAFGTAFVEAANAAAVTIPSTGETATSVSSMRRTDAPTRSRSELSRASLTLLSGGTQLSVGTSDRSATVQKPLAASESHTPHSPLSTSGSPALSLAIPSAAVRFDSTDGSPLSLVPTHHAVTLVGNTNGNGDRPNGSRPLPCAEKEEERETTPEDTGSPDFATPSASCLTYTRVKGDAEGRSAAVGDSSSTSSREFCCSGEHRHPSRMGQQGASSLTPSLVQCEDRRTKCVPRAARPPQLVATHCLVERNVASLPPSSRDNVQCRPRIGRTSASLRHRESSLPARYGVQLAPSSPQRMELSVPWVVSTSALRASYHDRALRAALNRQANQQ